MPREKHRELAEPADALPSDPDPVLVSSAGAPAHESVAVPAARTPLTPEEERAELLKKQYVVAPGMSVSSRRGRIAEGKPAKSEDFAGGEDAFVEIVRAGFLIEAPPKAPKKT